MSWSRRVTTSRWANCRPLLFRRVSEPSKALKGWGMDLSWWSLLKTTRFVAGQTNPRFYPQGAEFVKWCHPLPWAVRQEQSVVEVHRVTVKKDTEKVPNNTLFLTFNTPDLPKEITVGYLKVKVALFVPNPMRCFNCNKSGHTSHVRVVEKISMKVNVRDPSCALIAMVPSLHRLKTARSGRKRRRFNVSALRNAYPFQKSASWLKPRCRLWSVEVRPTPLPFHQKRVQICWMLNLTNLGVFRSST